MNAWMRPINVINVELSLAGTIWLLYMALTLIGIKIVIREKTLINEYRKLVNKNNNFIWLQGNHSGEKLLSMFTM